MAPQGHGEVFQGTYLACMRYTKFVRNEADGLTKAVTLNLALFDDIAQRFIDDGQKPLAALPVRQQVPFVITSIRKALCCIHVSLMRDDKHIAFVKLLTSGTVG